MMRTARLMPISPVLCVKGMHHMAYLQRLDKSPDTLRSFHLFQTDGRFDTIEYFLIHRSPADADIVWQSSPWHIIAVGGLTSSPWEWTLRLLHIDEEALEYEPFDAWQDGMGMFTLTPPEWRSVQIFLADLADRTPPPPQVDPVDAYFVPATEADYVVYGVPRELLEEFAFAFDHAHLYRYQPDSAATRSDSISFVKLSEWTVPLDSPATTADLAFQTYTHARIAEIQTAWREFEQRRATEPFIDGGMLDAVTELRLTRGALSELADLLGERLPGT